MPGSDAHCTRAVRRRGGEARRRRAALLALLSLLLGLAVPGAVPGAELGRLLAGLEPALAFPGADRLGAPAGNPPVVAAFRGSERLGFVFLNSDFVNAVGYSGKPIHVLVAMDGAGVLRGVRLVEHHEPIVLIGIPEERIVDALARYQGLDIVARVRDQAAPHDVDMVSGATVTVMVIDDTIVRSAIKVARRLGLGGLPPEAPRDSGPKVRLAPGPAGVEDWTDLVANGSVRRLKVSVGEVNRAFEAAGDARAAARPEPGPDDATFIELHAALVSIPTIGRSLLGEGEFRNLQQRLEPGRHAILVAARGRYSFKGSGYVRGGIFDRFQLIQGDESVRFRDFHHKRLRALDAEGAPALKEVDLFRLPDEAAFDPTRPWRLELLVGRATGPTTKAFVTFDLEYRTPARYLEVQPAAAPTDPGAAPALEQAGPPLWQRLWRDKRFAIAALAVALGALTLVFFFQTWLVRRPVLTDRLRIAFLLFTVLGIGFYANAQLSVVNILTVFSALVSGFDWAYFLMEPLVFILWGSVAAALIFWGRGPYCGWLCPFGALQELLNRVAKAARVPQLRLPWGLHERLWPVKYLVFLVLFGASLHSLSLAEFLAEVEPFKTAIVLKFDRAWPFVLFAGGLLVIGLFIERFYCRYLCALGAALAIPGRLRMFEWLKRYRECGSPCQRCANDCMVQAIHPEGHINPNECLYCLHCQVLYHDDQRCPVMIQRRLKRERRAATASQDAGAQIRDIIANIKAGREARAD